MTANAVSGRTGVFALLGSPVGHSLSPAIHNASFAQLGLDYVYLCHDVEAGGIGEAVAGARALGYAGLNVTMPCKAAVVDHLDALSPAAELMGAVNTVECAGGRLVGHNTDGAGLLRSIAEEGFEIAGSRMVVIGAGGIAVFKRRDASFAAAAERVAAVSDRTGADMAFADAADRAALAAEVEAADIVVDATRAGMAPLEGVSNVEAEWMRPGQAIVDTVYHPRETKLLALAARSGARPIGGLGMLLWQAAVAEEIWLGASMPVERIRAAIEAEG